MKNWTKILPLFFIEWYAKKNAACYDDKDGEYVLPYNNVKIYLKKITNW